MGHDDSARIRLEEAHDVGEGYGLAHAAAPDNGDGFARVDAKIRIDQNRSIERLIDVAELDVMRVQVTGHVLAHASVISMV